MTIEIYRDELARDDVQALLADHVAAMHAFSPPEACHVLPGRSLADPSITFFTARHDGQLLGMGALKALGRGEGEVKSMRTVPAALRQGVATAVLNAILTEAKEREYRALLLETGTGPEFAAANKLYDRAGFIDCPSFGNYRESSFTRFLRLDL